MWMRMHALYKAAEMAMAAAGRAGQGSGRRAGDDGQLQNCGGGRNGRGG